MDGAPGVGVGLNAVLDALPQRTQIDDQSVLCGSHAPSIDLIVPLIILIGNFVLDLPLYIS
jgi:hypothetical protein